MCVHRSSSRQRHSVAIAETPVRIRYDAPNLFAPVAQLEERDASNVEGAGPSPARSPISNARVAKRLRRRIANPVFVSSSLTARSNSSGRIAEVD